MNAAELPGDLYADPADRLIVATARERGLSPVTSDGAILRYGADGHARTTPAHV